MMIYYRLWKTIHGLIGGALTLIALTVPASADGHWPADFDSPIDFYSTDMTPIEVRLGKAVLHIPRAAIIFADGYSPMRLSRLPDIVETREIAIVVVYPDGQPLSAYAHELATGKHHRRENGDKGTSP